MDFSLWLSSGWRFLDERFQLRVDNQHHLRRYEINTMVSRCIDDFSWLWNHSNLGLTIFKTMNWCVSIPKLQMSYRWFHSKFKCPITSSAHLIDRDLIIVFLISYSFYRVWIAKIAFLSSEKGFLSATMNKADMI